LRTAGLIAHSKHTNCLAQFAFRSSVSWVPGLITINPKATMTGQPLRS